MRLIDKRKAVMQSAQIGKKIFNNTRLIYSNNGGTIQSTEEGLLFSSTAPASWMLYAQATGEPQDFKRFSNLLGHRLKVEADIEWIDIPTNNSVGRFVVSVGFYNSTDGATAFRARYRDNGFYSDSPVTHITDSFISNYDAYPGGSITGIDNYYFMFRIFLNASNGGKCLLKNFNVYDLGVER